MMAFYIEKPADRYGNIGIWSDDNNKPYPIIEAELIETTLGKELHIIAPIHIASRWPQMTAGNYLEVSGPVRDLTYDEYKSLFPVYRFE